jgi:hypothetical protein
MAEEKKVPKREGAPVAAPVAVVPSAPLKDGDVVQFQDANKAIVSGVCLADQRPDGTVLIARLTERGRQCLTKYAVLVKAADMKVLK